MEGGRTFPTGATRGRFGKVACARPGLFGSEGKMADEARRRMEMEAALKQIKTIQKRQAKNRGRRVWRLDVSLPKLALQGFLALGIGVLVGLGAFVLYRIVFA